MAMFGQFMRMRMFRAVLAVNMDMGVGQEDIADIFRLNQKLPELLYNSSIAVFITSIDHHPTTLNGIQPGVHNSIARIVSQPISSHLFVRIKVYIVKSILNPKIIQIGLKAVLSGKASIHKEAFFVVPFFETAVVEQFQVVLNAL